MATLTGSDKQKFIDEQGRIIFQEKDQNKAVNELRKVIKKYENDTTILNSLKVYFKANSEKQSLTDYERKLASIYQQNIEEMIKQKKLKIDNPIKFPSEEEFKKSQEGEKPEGEKPEGEKPAGKKGGKKGGKKVEVEIPPDPKKTALVPAPPAEQPPAVSPVKKTATKKKPQSAPLDTSRPLQKAFADLYSDDPNALRVFFETLEEAKGKSKKKRVIKADILALRPNLAFVGNKSMKTDKLIDIVKDSIGAWAMDNNLPQIQKDWELTVGDIGLEMMKQQLKPEQQKEVEEHEKAKSQEEIENIIMEKFKKNKNEQIADTFLQHNPATNTATLKNIDFTPKHIKKTGYTAVQDSIVKSLTEIAYIGKYGQEFEKLYNTERFKQRTPEDKVSYLNQQIKHNTKPEDLNNLIADESINTFYTNLYNFIMKGNKQSVDIHDINEATRAIKNLREEDLLTIKNEFISPLNEAVIQNAREAFKPVLEEINKPADISVLPPRIKPSMIKEEDILTPLDKYNRQKDELAKEMKKQDYEKLKMRKNMGTATGAELKALNDIEGMKEALKKLEPEAKKEQAKKSSNISKTTTATKRSGQVRPHFLNSTEKAVQNAIGETVEQQISDIKNWYIFDLPEYSTGVGNKYENPLVKQNEQREMMLYDKTDIFSGLTTFLLDEGVDERKDFYMSSRPALTRGSIGRGLFEVEVDETEEQFLQRFNEGSNGLFLQDQTKMEVSDFKNIYQTPPDHIIQDGKNTGEKHEFEFTNNRGIKHTDKIWINNINLFYDNAPILG